MKKRNGHEITKKRKLEHIQICLDKDIQARTKTAGWEDIEFVHKAVPEIDLAEIDYTTDFLGHKLSAPIIIAGMTGGTPIAKKINKNLAIVAQELNIGLNVGSQRAAIENPSLSDTYSIVREYAPSALIIGNIGAPQLSEGTIGLKEAKIAAEMIQADALAVHLNATQEALQPEGEAKYRRVLAAIHELVNNLDIPVIAKETGSGIAKEDAIALEKVGVHAIDAGGAGGTSWVAVESYRANAEQENANIFWDWGIPTAVSTVEVATATNIPVISTGGVRSGLDIAKAIALGATCAGIAHPLLAHSYEGNLKMLSHTLTSLMKQLQIVMFLTGSKSISDLRNAPIVITGKTAEWLKIRCPEFLKKLK